MGQTDRSGDKRDGSDKQAAATAQTNENDEEGSKQVERAEYCNPAASGSGSKQEQVQQANQPLGNGLMDGVWSTAGLASSGRLFQRNGSAANGCLAPLRSRGLALEEAGNQAEELGIEQAKALSSFMDEKQIHRSWSAPPRPNNFEGFLSQASLEDGMQQLSMLELEDCDTTRLCAGETWSSQCDDGADSNGTVTPATSPCAMSESHSESSGGGHAAFGNAACSEPSFLVEVECDERAMSRARPTPLGFHDQQDLDGMAGKFGAPSPLLSNIGSASRLRVGDRIAESAAGYARTSFSGGSEVYRPQSSSRFRERSSSHPSFPSAPGAAFNPPPGFRSPYSLGVFDVPATNYWGQPDPVRSHPLRVSSPAVLPVEFVPAGNQVRYRTSPSKTFGGVRNRVESAESAFCGATPAYASAAPGSLGPRSSFEYEFSHTPQYLRSKLGPPRTMEMQYVHPVAHSYSSHSLLEEFKAASKTDKWDLTSIKGHLVQFARDQAGSRFIQQKLEKADDSVRRAAFDEVFPQSLSLMTDVFGNYVIQKFFDHGSLQQQQLLVEQMRNNMIRLALQVYGCRVIQKALEVCQPEEQLALIRELKGHVMKCVVDQNGNHVLQKCIEAASWKSNVHGHNGVNGEAIQFIVDAFVGQAAVLSTHAYGCRVVQRVLEHCSPDQIRPIVDEIVVKCRELVKDQFGNYVVQHVIIHGEPDERNVVMEAIIPEIAKWSQHKYASNVVEACLERATKQELSHIIDFILQADDTGSTCPLLPMMKHMYGNYVVQKLLDKADPRDRQRMVCIIQHNADYLKRFTYGKHVLSRLERVNNGAPASFY